MKPQSMKTRKAMKTSENSNNNDGTCFDFNELSVALDATESTLEIPTGPSSCYDFTSLSKALSVVEEDNKSNEPMLKFKEEMLKFQEEILKFREVTQKLRHEHPCDVISLSNANEARLRFQEAMLKFRVATLKFRYETHQAFNVAKGDKKASYDANRLKFCEMKRKLRDQSRRAVVTCWEWRHILSEYGMELGLGKEKSCAKEQRKLIRFPIHFLMKQTVAVGDSRRRRDTLNHSTIDSEGHCQRQRVNFI